MVCAGFMDPWGSLGMNGAATVDMGTNAATRAIDGVDPYLHPWYRNRALAAGVTAVRVDGVPVDLVELPPLLDPDDPRKFTARFPRISQDQTLLEIDFTAWVFRYGTPFVGVAGDTEIDEVGVAVTPGDAVSEILSDRISVQTSLDGDILADVEVAPNPFSPNGDGKNFLRLCFGYENNENIRDGIALLKDVFVEEGLLS